MDERLNDCFVIFAFAVFLIVASRRKSQNQHRVERAKRMNFVAAYFRALNAGDFGGHGKEDFFESLPRVLFVLGELITDDVRKAFHYLLPILTIGNFNVVIELEIFPFELVRRRGRRFFLRRLFLRFAFILFGFGFFDLI